MEARDIAQELRRWADGDIREMRRDQMVMGAIIDANDLTRWADLMDEGAEVIERLRAAFRVNALRTFPDWSHEKIDAEIRRIETGR